MILSRLHFISSNAALTTVSSACCTAWRRSIHSTPSSFTSDAPGSTGGSAGSQGAAPGRTAGKDEDVKFGDTESSPSSGQLYGREDRDPLPSPNPAVTQATASDMSFPRDAASRGESEAAGASGEAGAAKHEGLKHPDAYPIQNDPSVPEGAGPELHQDVAEQLQQDESSGPKAAGQGVVEDLGKKDAASDGSDRSSPA